MADVGEDLKETFADVGTAFTILRDSGNLTGEFLVYEINRQVTKPFVREFFLEAELSYDTEVVAGDIITFDGDGRLFLVANVSPEQFENEVIEYQSVLYKCNVTNGKLWRSSGEAWGSNYRKNYNWNLIASGERALMTSSLYGHDLEMDLELGRLGLENHELYVSGNLDIKVMDRWEPFSGEFFLIKTIKPRRYENLKVIEVAIDTRVIPGDTEVLPLS